MVRFKGLLTGLSALGVLAVSAAAADGLKVFAAASLTEALDEALAVCGDKTGVYAIGVYSGSGTAARQIDQGAPAALYISANPQWMDWLEKRGRGSLRQTAELICIGNTLAMIAPVSTWSE